jgi:SAM-dependent methyltransferase
MGGVSPSALLRSATTTARRVAGRARRRLLALRRRGVRTDEPLTGGTERGAVRAVPSTVTIEERAPLRVQAIVRNDSAAPWSSRGHAGVMVTAAWHDRHGAPIDEPSATFPLPYPLPSGGEAVVPIDVRALDALGEYRLRVAVAQPGADLATTDVAVSVTARATDDLDYLDLYRGAELEADHWAIVGPQSRSEFDRLGDVKLQQMIAAGLTPHSRLLDVGCGTGLLAVTVEGYLADDGAYVGTDIGPEAVEYCRRRFRRPNFRFEVSGMTTLPLETPDDATQQFDAACFYSVFTHTYPDETALLLAETRRLLAPEGFVVADWFVSPMVERCAGHREALENDAEHMLRLVALAGFDAEVIETHPWKRFGERRFHRLTPR